MIIYLDCDGTIMEHAWPKIGRYNPFAFDVIIALQQEGYEVILNTMRGSISQNTLKEALEYINEYYWRYVKEGLAIKPITHTPEKIHPHPWPYSDVTGIDPHFNKSEDDLYIDDIAIYTPLRKAVMTEGNMVDWVIVARHLVELGILKTNPLQS